MPAMSMSSVVSANSQALPVPAIFTFEFSVFRSSAWKFPEPAIELGCLDAERGFLTKGGVFSDSMLDAYIELKMSEVTRLRMATHPIEFDMYYSL